MSRNMLDILVILLIISASEELVADFKVIVVLLGAFHVAEFRSGPRSPTCPSCDLRKLHLDCPSQLHGGQDGDLSNKF